jgi:hypothetical protein
MYLIQDIFCLVLKFIILFVYLDLYLHKQVRKLQRNEFRVLPLNNT